MPGTISLRRLRLSAFAAQALSPANAVSPSALAIAEIRAYPLREPVSRRMYTAIEVLTKSGLAGWGECAVASAEGLSLAKRIAIGRPATTFEVINGQLAVQPNLQAAINMALLDILGKHAKAPVYQLLGGPTRNKARALATLQATKDEDLDASIRRGYKAGHRAFIVPTPAVLARNQGQAFVKATRGRLQMLGSTPVGEVDFVLDGGGNLSPGDAAGIAAAVERFRLLWFDEPCRVSNLAAIRKISSESVTPLGFGRRIHQAGAFQDLLREDAIDILRPSLSLNGLSQIRRMAALAETYYTAIAPYHDGGPIATAAALHLAASVPNFFIQQIPFPDAAEDRAMRAQLAGASIEIVRDGYLSLPAEPGLGITVNKEALETYKERGA